MPRLGWLILLISLGLNLGLGLRLFRPAADPPPRGFSGERHRLTGHRNGAGEERSGRGLSDSPRDSSQWAEVMSRRLDRMAARLELSPEQVQVFQASQRANFPGFLAQKAQVDQVRKRLNGLIGAPMAEADSIRSVIHELGQEQARLDSLITEALLKELDILDPEQRARYLRMLPVLKDGGHSRGPRPGRRFGGQRPRGPGD